MIPHVVRIALALLALGLAPGQAFAGGDPAVTALSAGDAYASPRALGPAAAAGQEQLRGVAEELHGARQPVKLAVVAGPVGSPSMRAYVRKLRRRLGFEGTVVVTAPGHTVVAEGPRAPAEVTRRLGAARVGRIGDPVERVVAAARLAVPPAAAETPPSSTRTIGFLIGLAVLGGAAAVAWGLRRERRHEGAALSEAQAVMSVCLDALRARASGLTRRTDLPEEARTHAESALAAYADARAQLATARDVASVDRAMLSLRRGLHEASVAAEALGEELPADDPFAGLCSVDPAHGAATATGRTADLPVQVPLCEDCRAAAADGKPRARRLVPAAGRPIPFSEADLRFPEIPTPGGIGLREREGRA